MENYDQNLGRKVRQQPIPIKDDAVKEYPGSRKVLKIDKFLQRKGLREIKSAN